MKKNFQYDFEHKAIIGSKSAISRANKGMNPEYKELSSMLEAMPSFSVQIKYIQKKKDQKRYPKLTFEKMEDYIRTQASNEDDLNAKIIEFNAIKKVAEAKGAKYPLTKKWFLKTYPEYSEKEVSENEAAFEEQRALAAAAKALEGMELDNEDLEEEAPEIEEASAEDAA
ncbi:MAG: hypothetical protein K6E83_00955 [Clostridium sp.]|nr:hypothetical protein [Clostridium sp.]